MNWNAVSCFRQFLRQAAIRLPEPIAVYTNYTIRIARQIASGEIDAFSAVKTLCETHSAMESRRKVSFIGFMPGFSFDVDRFKLLANGIMPGSFELLGYAPELADRIRVESAKFVEQNATLEITSDDPEDWPMIRFG